MTLEQWTISATTVQVQAGYWHSSPLSPLPLQRLQIVLNDSRVELSADGALATALSFGRLVPAKVKGIPMMTWIPKAGESGPLLHPVLCMAETG